MDIYEYDEYELDIKRTLVANLDKVPLVIVGLFYLSMFNAMMNGFVLPEMVVIAAFILAWSLVKIMNLLSCVALEYKPRRK